MRTYTDTNSAYLGTLKDIYQNYDFITSPRGLTIREKINYSFVVENPSSDPIETLDITRNKVIANYTQKEFELYNSGTNSAAAFAKASKFWEKIANPDGTVNSAYGYLIWVNDSCGNPEFGGMLTTPWAWAKRSLIADKNTRQAVMRFSLPEHQWEGNKDQPCTMHANWLIRDDKLHLSVVMRSNDVVLGLVYDLPWFCSLMDKMLDELKPTYPDLQKGSYTHFVHSMHAYERDISTIEKMLGM